VTTAAARLEMRPLERLGIQAAGTRRLVEQPADLIDSDYKPGLRHQAGEVVAAVRGQPCSLPTLAASTRSMRLVAAIYGLAVVQLPL